MFDAFIRINQHIAKNGSVETGQVLYVPPLKPADMSDRAKNIVIYSQGGAVKIDDEAAIVSELTDLNDLILRSPAKARKYLADGHHFLAVTQALLIAQASLSSGGTIIDISQSRTKLARELVIQKLKKIEALAKQARRAKGRGAKAPFRAKINELLHELDTAVYRYLRVAGTSDEATRVNFHTVTGAKWKRSIYDVKRIGLDPTSVEQMSKHINATIRAANAYSTLGRISIALALGESAATIGEACYEHGAGKICWGTAAVEATGLGGGAAGAVFGEMVAKGITKSAACNLLLDIETGGMGALICQLVVPVGGTIGGAYAGGQGTKFFAKTALKKVYSVDL